MADTPYRDPMQDFADRIIAELEKGVKPWVRPWDADNFCKRLGLKLPVPQKLVFDFLRPGVCIAILTGL